MRALLSIVALGVLSSPGVAAVPTLGVRGHAFGQALAIEAVVPTGLARSRAENAMRDAAAAVREVEAATDPTRGPLADLNAAAGKGAHTVPPALLEPLRRAVEICTWSEGIDGPLGGHLYELWGLRAPRPSLPTPDDIGQAAATAGCDRLVIDVQHSTAALATGSVVDLWGFAVGGAVDRAVERLRAGGLGNASVTIGGVQRAIGSGPGEGRGWPLRVTVPPGVTEFTTALALRDQSFALAPEDGAALRAGGVVYTPYLDQRQGQPATGVRATLIVSELAVDAQAVAAVMFAAGNRRGSYLLGSLQPPPAVLWLLGTEAQPLVTDYHWGARVRRSGG